MSLRARPCVLCPAISRIVSTDSCLAVSMNEQVLTTMMSASSAREVIWAPLTESNPIITSESTRFLGQPRLTKPMRGMAEEDGEEDSEGEAPLAGAVLRSVDIAITILVTNRSHGKRQHSKLPSWCPTSAAVGRSG